MDAPQETRGPTSLLLTATVDVGDTVFVARSNPTQRLKDYEWALNRWLLNKSVEHIVFCENSGYDLSSLTAIVTKHRAQDRVELLSFRGEAPRYRGKGYGEAEAIKYALDRSRALGDSRWYLKVTGRYYVRNGAKFFSYLRRVRPYIMANFGHDLTWADTRIFGGSVEFLDKYLCPLRSRMDDTAGVYIEHALAMAVHQALFDMRTWSLPPTIPDIEGVYGTSNTRIELPRWRQFARELLFNVKRELYGRHP